MEGVGAFIKFNWPNFAPDYAVVKTQKSVLSYVIASGSDITPCIKIVYEMR